MTSDLVLEIILVSNVEHFAYMKDNGCVYFRLRNTPGPIENHVITMGHLNLNGALISAQSSPLCYLI